MPFLKLSAIAAVLMASAISHASAATFQSRIPDSASDTSALNAPLRSYRALTLDVNPLRAQLQRAPDEHSATPAVKLDLPMPDGTAQPFAVWRAQPMAPELAARYPQIRSYVARAIDHPEIEARLDDSPHGFSAMIRSPHGVTMVQPVQLGNVSRYISFRREDLGKSVDPFHCLLDSAASAAYDLFDTAAATPQTTTGASVRTYRLALAATGEYTQFFGGTVEDGLAAIVEAVNRINGIYLTDFAVQFQLVANDDNLVYIDPDTDPYTNDDGGTMLGENQSNMDSVIGSANYDFGHVFSTGGGGVADLGVACANGAKAMGVTGLSNPTGDAFWVDYVAHEMGHQMGANHSFNTTDGSCGGGNRAGSQAAEPGSGSTIMAYAGICGPSDLQPHSDAFFHAISLTPIVQRLAGGGGSCGTAVASTNQAPVVASVAPHTIPASTPFMVTGAATDADAGDVLSYEWDAMDHGTASPPETDNGNRALFRSFTPQSTGVRLIPELPRILAHDLSVDIPPNGDIPGETWATTNRTLHFRLTVRDNHPGGGATVSTDTTVQVTSSAGPFRVTAPASGASWPAYSTQTVTWNVANTTAAPVNCAAVDILFSVDGGSTFATTLAESVSNTGSADVTVPNLVTTDARIEVLCHDNIFFDISPADFTIVSDLIFADGFETPD
ncbi:MAG TPA: zinc-dependent metalloprotease family protein [Rudaea sp.]|nr:zinc-dependent metalloprotease family protein [Rudaea sp.]